MHPVILDVDSALGVRGGDIDDALAIAFMAGHVDRFPIAGITVTAGNATRSSALKSVETIVKALKMNVEIAIGRDRPLKKSLVTGHSFVMGGSTAEEWILPEDADNENRAAAPPRRDAIGFLADELRAGPRILLPTAPLSTIAAFLQAHPELANRIVRIVTMGGGFIGEGRGPEFNIMTDPTAAAIVYSSGIPMAIAPIEMTVRARLYPRDIPEWKGLSPAGRLFFDGTMDWLDQMKRVMGEAACCLHDPLAAGCLCHPELFETKGIVPAVDEATGRTEVVAYDESSPVRLITDYDVEGFRARFLEALRRVLS